MPTLPPIVALLDSVELRRADTAPADQAGTGLRVALQQIGRQAVGAWAQQRQASDPAVQHPAPQHSPGTPPSAPSR